MAHTAATDWVRARRQAAEEVRSRQPARKQAPPGEAVRKVTAEAYASPGTAEGIRPRRPKRIRRRIGDILNDVFGVGAEEKGAEEKKV